MEHWVEASRRQEADEAAPRPHAGTGAGLAQAPQSGSSSGLAPLRPQSGLGRFGISRLPGP
eukprot:4640091-Alexandrium_andersonii.AAC.1